MNKNDHYHYKLELYNNNDCDVTAASLGSRSLTVLSLPLGHTTHGRYQPTGELAAGPGQ